MEKPRIVLCIYFLTRVAYCEIYFISKKVPKRKKNNIVFTFRETCGTIVTQCCFTIKENIRVNIGLAVGTYSLISRS